MAYIFLDESGDLGLDLMKKKTSRYFVITCLFVNSKRPVEKIVTKIVRGFRKADLKKHRGVLHAYKESPSTRHKLLNELTKHQVAVVSIYLNKAKVYTKFQDGKHVLYNYVANILLDRIYTKKLIPTQLPITLIASRRETNKFLNQNFCNYLIRQVDGNHQVNIDILIRNPQQEKCLQIVDCVCWALFRKREHGDDSYADIIKKLIVEESPLFP